MKYKVDYTSIFSKQYKKILKQDKDIEKLDKVIEILANGKELDYKYRNHKLINNRKYKECYECHIEPDWLLIYKYDHDKLILLLFSTGSHSELFK